jgi:hypothetical protein
VLIQKLRDDFDEVKPEMRNKEENQVSEKERALREDIRDGRLNL